MPNHEKYDTICRVPVKESGQRLIEKAISAMKDINETTKDTNDGMKDEGKTGRRLTGKRVCLSMIGALLIAGLGVVRAPLLLSELSPAAWAVLRLVPLAVLFPFFLLVRIPERSVFRFSKCFYCIVAPTIPAFLLSALYDFNQTADYTKDFFGSFLLRWVSVWVLGMLVVYALLRLFEYIGKRCAGRDTLPVRQLYDLAVMFTPQKKLRAKKREGKGKWVAAGLCILMVALGVFIFVVALFLFNVYSNMEFEAILFTIRFAEGGLAAEDIIAGTEYTLLFVVIAGFISYNLIKCFRNDSYVVADSDRNGEYTLVMTGKKRAIHIVLSAALMVACFTFFALQTNFLHYMSMKSDKSTIYEDHYVKPDASVLTFPEKKRNLIFIYLESYETTYTSREKGGSQDQDYLPELTALAGEKDSVHFSNTDKLGGASVFVPSITYTQGSTVAQTSGISLNTLIFPQNGEVKYPTMIRLEDILHDNGYNQLYIEGSKGEFSMYNRYVARYDDSKLYDRKALVDQGYASEEEDYIWKWGIEDRKLFDVTKELITEASKEDKPFFVTMYTMDTHSFECGHRCKLCDETIGSDYLAAVNCTSRQTAEFVDWVKQQPFYENTTVILVGDHLGNQKTSLVDIDEGYVRTTYNCFINPAKTPVRTKDRSFSSLDMFPTTLSAIGVEIKGDRLGLGTDLFSDTKTLSEELGEEEYKQQLEKESDYYDRILCPD